MIGQKFGKFTVIEFVGSQGKRKQYLCECDCGTRKTLRQDVLVRVQYKSCGCEYRRKASQSSLWTGHGEISGAKWAAIKCSAKVRKIQFEVSIQDGWEQFQIQDRKCALSGLPLGFPKHRGDTDYSASLDRKDSSLPYCKGNIQWVDKRVNMMKGFLGEIEFKELCKIVSQWGA